MKRICFFILIVCFATLGAQAQQADTTLGEIRGKVIDARTKQPFIYASVWVQSGDSTIAKTISDEEGAYVIKDLAPGAYKLLSYGPRCEERTVIEEMNVLAGKASFCDVRLMLCKGKRGLWQIGIQTAWTDTLPAYLSDSVYSSVGWVKGKVVDAETGKPMQFVSVQIDHEGCYAAAQVLTDSNGRYMFRDLPFGPYVVRTSYAEYKSSAILDIELNNRNKIVVHDIKLEKGVGTVYKNPVVVQKPFPLIDPEGKSGRTYRAEELQRLPVR